MDPDVLEGNGPPTFSGQQLALIGALDKRAERLGAMYRGGLRVLEDFSNPERFVLCAHCMRELMEKLPEVLDVPIQAQKESLKVKVQEIEEAYASARRKTACTAGDGNWQGPIDSHLQKFLRRLQTFFDWFSSHHPRRRAELQRVVDGLDPAGRGLPPPLASLTVEAWDRKRSYFNTIAHHRSVATEPEFRMWLDALERFLLDRMEPRTFENFDAIDALLAQETSDAAP